MMSAFSVKYFLSAFTIAAPISAFALNILFICSTVIFIYMVFSPFPSCDFVLFPCYVYYNITLGKKCLDNFLTKKCGNIDMEAEK